MFATLLGWGVGHFSGAFERCVRRKGGVVVLLVRRRGGHGVKVWLCCLDQGCVDMGRARGGDVMVAPSVIRADRGCTVTTEWYQ